MQTNRLKSLFILGCAVALLVGWLPSAQAAKEVFQRTKPHVNIGVINATDLAGNPLFSALFLCNVVVHPDGQASGVLQFHFEDGTVVHLQAVAGEAQLDEGGNVLQLQLLLFPEPGDPSSNDPVLATVTVASPSSPPDDLIWDLKDGFVFGPVRLPEDGRFRFTVEGRIDLAPPTEESRGDETM
jgi:hypothetical protein